MVTSLTLNLDFDNDMVGFPLNDIEINENTNTINLYIPLLMANIKKENNKENIYYIRDKRIFLNDSSCMPILNSSFKTQNFIEVEKNPSTQFQVIDSDNNEKKYIEAGTKIRCIAIDGKLSYITFDDDIIECKRKKK